MCSTSEYTNKTDPDDELRIAEYTAKRRREDILEACRRAWAVSSGGGADRLRAELAHVSEQLRDAQRRVIDLDRVRSALADVRLLYDVATAAERGELIRLLFKRLRLQKAGPLEAELFDHVSSVYRSTRVLSAV